MGKIYNKHPSFIAIYCKMYLSVTELVFKGNQYIVKKHFLYLMFGIIVFPELTYAAAMGKHDNPQLLLWLSILMASSLIAKLSNKLKQPIVLGQILLGVMIGILAHYKYFHLQLILGDDSIGFLAELGIIFLLFEIGIESSTRDLTSAGKHGILVALTGVLVPFLSGYFIVTPLFLHSQDVQLKLFIASLLSVTSTSISLSTFKELNILNTKACQTVLTASVIDDILGLSLLSIITGLSISHSVNWVEVGINLINIGGFILISIILGIKIIPYAANIVYKIGKNEDVLILFLLTFCFLMAWISGAIGLNSVIGAFFAGLVLENTAFYQFNPQKYALNHSNSSKHGIAKLIAPYGYFLTPIFFIYIGMQVDISSCFKLSTLLLAGGLSIVAIASKAVCGIFLPRTINRWIVGFGMVSRGEIGLIFAATGLKLNIINHDLFTVILLMVVVTSFIPPIVLNILARKNNVVI